MPSHRTTISLVQETTEVVHSPCMHTAATVLSVPLCCSGDHLHILMTVRRRVHPQHLISSHLEHPLEAAKARPNSTADETQEVVKGTKCSTSEVQARHPTQVYHCRDPTKVNLTPPVRKQGHTKQVQQVSSSHLSYLCWRLWLVVPQGR